MREPRAQVQVATNTINVGQMLLRQAIPVLVALVALWLLRDRILVLDPSQILHTLSRISPLHWGIAVAATAASFWAVGRYDECLHGLLGTGIATSAARLSGASAIAVGQFAGFGVLTGALARWRLLNDFSLWQALRLSLAVSVSFLAAWAFLTAAAATFGGGIAGIPSFVPTMVLAVGVGFLGLCLVQPGPLNRLPPMRAVLRILMLGMVDLGFAGLALYVLLPQDIGIGIAEFLPVFLLALGAGLVFGTPGGLGPFEVALIGLLPHYPHESLLASALGFRLVYYALPAAIGAVALALGARKSRTCPHLDMQVPHKPHLPPRLEDALWNAPRAELGLLRQGSTAAILHHGMPVAIGARARQTLTMIGDPMRRDVRVAALLRQLRRLARDRHLGALVYKCSGRVAQAARAKGWTVLPVAQEAWLHPATFTPDGPGRRQLRRQLRKAQQAQIVVREAGRDLPLSQMREIAREWAVRHQGERGFSMGGFDEEYVACQRAFVAWKGGMVVGFITLHECRHEWTLDLMRQRADAPDGTMHLLIAKAIEHALDGDVQRLSLAAVPLENGANDSAIVGRLRRTANGIANSTGLRRFKTSFDPHWTTLYAAAPSRLDLLAGLSDVARAIHQDTGKPQRAS